jgi:hypothetical protein
MAGNKNSGRHAGGPDFTGRVRALIERVLVKMETKGDAETLLTKAFEEDFAGTLRAMAAYAPKEQTINLITNTVEDIPDVDWDTLRQARSQLEPKHDKTTH